jgi:transposase
MIDSTDDLLSVKTLLSEVLLRVLSLEEEISALKLENKELRAENSELRRRLNMTSKNSDKPPSSEGYSKSPALGKSKGGQVGGQKGHLGHTLEMKSEVSEVKVHKASNCSCCGREFGDLDVHHVLYARQVFDLPVPQLEIREHQVVGIVCCGKAHIGSFPLDVNAPVQYGIRIKALGSLLNTDYRMPFGKISQLMSDLYGYAISESTLTSGNEDVYEALAPVEQEIKARVLASEVAHFDETGMRVAGELHWFHTACTAFACYLYVHKARGKEALEAAESVIKDFTNWAVHDCWASYFPFTACKHALCNAHILRELTALIENGSLWAADMHKFLLELYTVSQERK